MNDATGFLVFLVICGAIWFLLTRHGSTRPAARLPARDMIHDIEDDIKRERAMHHEVLSTALAACQKEHPDAVNALSWLAAQDGTVSKQELRNIFRFCAEQGTSINQLAYTAIDSLNAGMSMTVKTTEIEAHQSIESLVNKPVAYRLAFYGATNKLCGSHKNLSQAKQRFLKQAEDITGQK